MPAVYGRPSGRFSARPAGRMPRLAVAAAVALGTGAGALLARHLWLKYKAKLEQHRRAKEHSEGECCQKSEAAIEIEDLPCSLKQQQNEVELQNSCKSEKEQQPCENGIEEKSEREVGDNETRILEDGELEEELNVDNEEPNLDVFEELKHEGNLLFKNKKYQEAIDIYEKAMDFAKTNQQIAIINQNISVSYEHLEDLNKALDFCNKSISASPNYSRAMIRKGTINHKKGNYKEAVETFYQALKNNSHIPVIDKLQESLAQLALAHIKSKMTEVNGLNNMFSRNVSNTTISRFYTGLTCDPVLDYVSKAKIEDSADKNESENKENTSPESHKKLQNVYSFIEKLDYASAYEICFTAIYDKLEDFSKEDQAIVLNFMITIEIAMNFKDLALSHYKQIIENYTHDKKFASNLKLKMLSLDISSSQTHDKIQSQLKALIDEYDKNPDIYLMLSQVKMLQGQHFATELETAKKLSNGHPFIVLQESYLKLKTVTPAAGMSVVLDQFDIFEDYIKNKPRNIACVAAELYFESLMQYEMIEKAMNFAQEFFATSNKSDNNHDAHFYYVFAEFLASLHNFKEALKVLDKGLEVDPFYDRLHHTKIAIMSASGSDEIKVAIEQMTAKCPRSILLADAIQESYMCEMRKNFGELTAPLDK